MPSRTLSDLLVYAPDVISPSGNKTPALTNATADEEQFGEDIQSRPTCEEPRIQLPPITAPLELSNIKLLLLHPHLFTPEKDISSTSSSKAFHPVRMLKQAT